MLEIISPELTKFFDNAYPKKFFSHFLYNATERQKIFSHFLYNATERQKTISILKNKKHYEKSQRKKHTSWSWLHKTVFLNENNQLIIRREFIYLILLVKKQTSINSEWFDKTEY